MQLLIVSADEAKQHQERARLEHIRAMARADSLVQTRERFLRADAESLAASRLLEEAYLTLDEDEFDDYETASLKAEKLARIEREMDQIGDIWRNALLRCGWEVKDAQKGS